MDVSGRGTGREAGREQQHDGREPDTLRHELAGQASTITRPKPMSVSSVDSIRPSVGTGTGPESPGSGDA
jgi:hypothetical protein